MIERIQATMKAFAGLQHAPDGEEDETDGSEAIEDAIQALAFDANIQKHVLAEIERSATEFEDSTLENWKGIREAQQVAQWMFEEVYSQMYIPELEDPTMSGGYDPESPAN